MSGLGDGLGDVFDHDDPSSSCQARNFAWERGLQLEAPRPRCACRGITVVRPPFT
jgi:hypothetical protein